MKVSRLLILIIILMTMVLGFSLQAEATLQNLGVDSAGNRLIYDNDLELLIRNPRAFDSFLLAVAGRNLHTQSLRPMPEWTMPEETKFIVPIF